MYYSLPSSAYGYYRGAPIAGGQGAGEGPIVSGSNVFAAGQGTGQATGGSWNPTILYLFVLIFVEMFVFAFIARHI